MNTTTRQRGGARPGAGRPIKQRRLIWLRLEQQLYDAWEIMARQQNLPTATFITQQLRRSARQFKTQSLTIDV